MNQFVVLDGLHHEPGEVHASCEVAFEDRVPDVSAPDGQALRLAFLQVAAAHDGPPRVAGEDPLARFYLVVEVDETEESRDPARHLHQRLDLPRVHVLAIARDVVATREHQAGPGTGQGEHRLGGPR